MEYRQIKALIDYRELGYVEVYGEYQIRRYHQADRGDAPGNVQVIIYQMEYRQIKALIDYRELGYVEVYGEYQIRRYHQADRGDAPGNVQVEHKYEEPFRLYGHYENYEKCMEEISKR